MPYRGTGPAMQDLVAGNIDIVVDQASNAMPQVQGGKIRAYGLPVAVGRLRIAHRGGLPRTSLMPLAITRHERVW